MLVKIYLHIPHLFGTLLLSSSRAGGATLSESVSLPIRLGPGPNNSGGSKPPSVMIYVERSLRPTVTIGGSKYVNFRYSRSIIALLV